MPHSPNHLDRVPPFLHAPTSPVMNSSSNNPRPLPPNVGHNLQLVANATPQVPDAHLHAGRHHKPVPISRLCAQWSKGPMRLTSNHKSSSVQTAVSLAREGLLSKACQTLSSSGLAPDNNTTWNLLVSKHPKGTPPTPPSAPLLAAPHLPPNFNIMAVLHSFPKDTACGPSGLRIQHLIEAAEVPRFLFSSRSVLYLGRWLICLSLARFRYKWLGSLQRATWWRWKRTNPTAPPDIRPIAVGEAIRRLAGKCLCSMTKAKAHDFLAPFQLGVACQGGAEKIIHGLRSCVDEHWHEVDFAVLKIDLHNAFNRVSRQAVLNACALHIPELLPWFQWCYGQHPVLWHSLGTISSEIGVQQGPVAAIARVLAIIQESGPPLGLNINIAKCDLVFCAKFVAQKQSEASKLLKELEAVGSIDPQVALLLLRQYVLVPNWDLGKPAAFDLSITSTLQSSALLEASVMAGSTALLAENRKHNNSHKKCDELGWACIPLVVETYGCWGAEAVAALSKLAGRLSVRNNEPNSKTIFSLYSHLGLTLVRANCRAILSRLT
eukprot:Em0009g779a